MISLSDRLFILKQNFGKKYSILRNTIQKIPPDDIQNCRDEEHRIKAAGRLPPNQALTQKFPVLHYGVVPSIDPATWTLRVFGEVKQEMIWTWAEA